MARPEHGPNRPTSVQAARGQMPPSLGNTGSLSRPIGHGSQGKPPERTKKHRGPRLPSGPPMAPTGGPPPTMMYDAEPACGSDANGIKIKPSHKGLLHKDLGVPQGQKIPKAKVEAAEGSSDPAVRKRAIFAENAKKWNK